MEKKRLVFSSTGNRKIQSFKPPRRDKKNEKNSSLQEVARVYLHNPKKIPRHELQSLIRTSRTSKNHQKSNFLLKRLLHELQRRDQQFVSQNDCRKIINHSSIPRYTNERKYNTNASIDEEIEKEKKGPLINENKFMDSELRTSLQIGKRNIKRFQRISIYRQKLDEIKQQSNHRKCDKSLHLTNNKIKKERLKSAESVRSEKESKRSLREEKSICKIFSVNEKDQLVGKFLLSQGWRQCSLNSEYSTLKWTYNESLREYEIMKNQNKKGQKVQKFYNHIQNNLLVTKNGLHSLGYGLTEAAVKIDRFIPKTFILPQEKDQFFCMYEKITVLILIQRHIRYLQSKNMINETEVLQPDFLVKILRNKQYDRLLNQQQNPQIVVHLPLLIYSLLHASTIYFFTEGEQTEDFLNYCEPLLSDSRIKGMLHKFSRDQTPFQQYMNLRTSEPTSDHNQTHCKIIDEDRGYLRMKKPFITPSSQLIKILLFFHKYFSKQFPYYRMNGLKNLWIVKPCAGSKGYGIQILDNLDKISKLLQRNNHPKIIQKYIEDIWLIPRSLSESGSEISQFMVGRKFDLRQWVLLFPPKAYIFSQFYIRFCSRNYERHKIEDPTAHLSNLSINRSNFKNSSPEALENSVLNEENFSTILQKLNIGHRYSELKQKIQEKITYLVQQNLSRCSHISGCFQIVGFDILIDQQFNPWVIQGNMSPACQLRTQWLREMREQMTQHTLQIVLGENIVIRKNKDSIYKWKQLNISDYPSSDHKVQAQLLTVIGNKVKQVVAKNPVEILAQQKNK